MLRVNMKPVGIITKPHEDKDIIIKKVTYTTSYDTEGNEIKKRVITKVNLTKKINETAKVLKTMTAEEKIANIQQTLRG